MRAFTFAAGVGVGTAYFLDPDNGRRRRAFARDRGAAAIRRIFGRLGRVQAEASRVSQKVWELNADPRPLPDDASLTHKVEAAIFGDGKGQTGRITVSAENGVVLLWGEVETPELIRDLEERTRRVQGVQGVENLLHVPGALARRG